MLDRRAFLGTLGAAPIAAPAAFARTDGYADADYARAIVIDGLAGLNDPGGDENSLVFSARGAAEQRQSGVTAMQQTIGEVGNVADAWTKALASIGAMDRWIYANPALFLRARLAADIRRAKAEGRCAIIYGTQDTAMIGANLERVDVLAGLGVRVVQLTYNLRNLSGDGALEPDNAGLSRLGRATIEKIEDARLLLDLSHGGARTIAEAVAAAKRPLTISHTGCRALNDNPRNVADSALRAVAEKGGVVGIYWMPFLVANSKPTAADLIRHIDHAVNVCGEDHVGIGTDGALSALVIDAAARAQQRKFFEDRQKQGVAAPGEGADIFNYVSDLNSHMRFRILADRLSGAGWPGRRIDKLLGANLLRLYADAWGG